MTDPAPEYSESGNPILRHKPRDKPFEMAVGEAQHIQLIEGHISKHLGASATVFHEMVSDLVHIDIHIVPPRPGRNFYTLVTSGMSARAMAAPPGREEFSYAELLLSLPPGWRLQQEDLKDEQNYWPLRLLKMLARFPHIYDTWLSYAHSIPNGNPGKPYAANTKLCGAILTQALLVPEEFHALTVSPEMKIRFYGLVPLYQEEMELKLKHGADALFKRFEPAKISELLDIRRKNVARKFLGLF
jgi:hypothetical protein